MSSSIVWSIPNETIEEAVKANLKLEGTVTVWGAVFDEVGLNVGVILEVDDEDLERLGVDDMRCHQLEDGDTPQ